MTWNNAVILNNYFNLYAFSHSKPEYRIAHDRSRRYLNAVCLLASCVSKQILARRELLQDFRSGVQTCMGEGVRLAQA